MSTHNRVYDVCANERGSVGVGECVGQCEHLSCGVSLSGRVLFSLQLHQKAEGVLTTDRQQLLHLRHLPKEEA